MSDWKSSDVAGIQVLRRSGSGSPVLLLPGVMADAGTWQPVADAMDIANPVLIINRRGREPSRPLGDGYGVPVEVDDLSSVVSVLDGTPHLFGWSYGGLIAIEAVARGLNIRSLVAYEPVSRPFVPGAIAPIRHALAANDPDRAVEIVNIDVSGFDPADVAALRAGPAWPTLRRLAAPLGEELDAIDRFDPAYGRYAEIDVPATLIVGALNEGRSPYGDAFNRFADTMPFARLDRIPRQGHLAHVEAPGTLADHIVRAVATAGI